MGKAAARIGILSALVIALLITSGCTGPEDEIENKLGSLLTLDTSKMTKQEIAVATGNPEVCKDASHPDVCLLAVAKSENDITICDEIKDPGYKTQCINAVRNYAEGVGDADCGKDMQPCCPGELCEYGHECRVDMKCHVTCGQLEYICCDSKWCDTAKNLVCNNDNTCVVCGELNNPCCTGWTCNDDHMVCHLGYCRDPAEVKYYPVE